MEPNKVLKALDGVIAQNLSLTAEALRTSRDSVRRKLIKALKNCIVQYGPHLKPTWALSYLMSPSNPNVAICF